MRSLSPSDLHRANHPASPPTKIGLRRKRTPFGLETQILVVLFFIYLAVYATFRASPLISSGFYLFPPLLVLAGYIQGGFRGALLPFPLFGCLCIYTLVSIAWGSFDGPEVIFLFLSASMFLVQVTPGIPFERLCALAGLTYVFLNPAAAFNEVFGGSVFNVYTINIETSELEAALAIVFGPAVLVAFHNKNWTYMLLNSAFLVILSKRIAVLSLLIGMLLYFADFVFRGKLRRSRLLGVSIVVISAAVGATMPRLLDFIRTALNWDVNLNLLTSGRYNVQSRFLYAADSHFSILNFIVGHGVGAHHAVLDHVTWALGSYHNLLHDDWMRIFYDYGLIGVAIACVVFVRVSRISRLHFALAGYTVVAFLTGNAFSYVFYWGILSLIVIRTDGRILPVRRPLAPERLAGNVSRRSNPLPSAGGQRQWSRGE
jgi:hypothetical protein